jgi:mono/diheme cytochrome c family protein
MRTQPLLILAGFCLLAAPGRAQNAPAASAPTWNQDVAPIVFNNCITCHRPGEVAPMSLLSYAEARPWAKGIKAKVVAREMPPWFADPRYGRFDNRRGLTETQIETIAAWADSGSPQGTGPVLVAPEFGDRSAELMDRAPDAIIEGVELEIPPNIVLPTLEIWTKAPFAEDKYIEAVENRPSNRAVTHHSTFSAAPLPRGGHHIGVGPAWPGGPLVNAVPVREDGSQVDEGAVDEEAGEAVANTDPNSTSFPNVFTFYAPGTGALRFKPGLVKVMRRDDYLRWGLHYNATGRVEVDRPSARLWFSRAPASELHQLRAGTANHNNLYEGQEMIGSGVRRPNIPAHAENYRIASLRAIQSDTTLNSLWPHMHARGKDMTYSITYPDGREEIILSVPRYSFEWQLQYQFAEAIKLPAGSMLRVVAHFDNSSKNKFNPAPDQELPWGGQSWHEMYFPYFDLAIDKDVLKPVATGTN